MIVICNWKIKSLLMCMMPFNMFMVLPVTFAKTESIIVLPTSPTFVPFTADLPLPADLQPSEAFTPECELRPEWGDPVFYKIYAKNADAQIVPGISTPIWGYNGMYPGPTVKAVKGRPAVVRFYNELNVELSTHNHGGHQAAESDGFPNLYIEPGQYRDYCYPHISPENDPSEFTSTQWYHDHAMDITAENVYRGLAGFYLTTDEVEQNLIANGTLPKAGYDIPLVIQDKRFNADGTLFYDVLNHDGFLGDVYVVNGKAQPKFQVERRKYRFRILNGSNARFYELRMSNRKPFIQLGVDSWLLPQAMTRATIPLAPAERADVVIDFTDAPSVVYLENTTEQLDGRGPSGRLRTPIKLLKFEVIEAVPVQDATIKAGDALRPHTKILPSEIVKTRVFDFERSHGAWVINGEFFDPDKDNATPAEGTAERWILRNKSGGWQHPVHIHLEANQIQKINGKAPIIYNSFKKDTVVLAPNTEAEIFMKFRTFPGRFVFHCHNIDHEDMRMMGVVNVIDDAFAASSKVFSKPVVNFIPQKFVQAINTPRSQIANIQFTTQDNRKVKLYDDLIKGRTVLINFMFTKCDGVCPLMTNNLVKVQKLLGDRIGKDIHIISISMDPKRDTPNVLKNYANSRGVGEGWTFLTGDAAEIDALRRSLGLYDPDPVVDADPSQHTGLVTFGNDVTGKWASLPAMLQPKHLVEAVLKTAAVPNIQAKK